MFKTLNNYNDRNNIPLSNANIREETCKFIEEESISDANYDTAYKSSHAYNTQRENANTIFTSEKIDKPDGLVDAVNNLTINNDGYYKSNTATTSYSQGDLTRNTETVNHTSNKN